MKFIDPRIDFAFKKIFGSEDAKDILISFLESLLKLEGERRIQELTILDPFLAPRIRKMKYSILDVKCTDHRGISYIIEMQVQKVEAFLKRIQYNTAKVYVNQIVAGEDYTKLKQVIAITITDFIQFKNFDHCISYHENREMITGQSYLSDIFHCFIELPKFTKTVEELTDIMDKWIYFVRYAGSLEAIPDVLRTEPFCRAFERARVANMTSEELEMYEKACMAIVDARGLVVNARREGVEEGIQIGEEKGRKAGRQEEAAAMLLKLIHRKFGQAPDAITEKVASAKLEHIEMWAENILFAHSLDDVFAS